MCTQVNYIRPKLADYQTEIIDSEKRFTITEACTKSGKTVSHIVWLFEQALKNDEVNGQDKEGMEYWWVAPVYAQAEIAFKRMQYFINDKSLFTANGSKMTIELFNGSILRFKSAEKPDNLYGSNVYAAVFDEFTRAKVDSWYALRSTLTITEAKCKLIGNYVGSLNWGHKLGQKAREPNSEYQYFKIDAYDAIKAGIIKEEELDQARRDLPKSIFESLYLALGSASNDILFSADSISNLFTNDFVKPTKDRYITADIALHGSDRFVIGLWHGWVLKEVITIDKCDADEVEKALRDFARAWKVPLTNIVYDADGIGAFLKGYLRQAKPFNNGASPIKPKGKKVDKINYANLKTQCYYLLAKQMDDNLIFIEDDYYKEDIEKELEVIRRYNVDDDTKLRITPKKEIKKILGYSPDFADMIMMRIYFKLKKSGRGYGIANLPN